MNVIIHNLVQLFWVVKFADDIPFDRLTDTVAAMNKFFVPPDRDSRTLI